MYSAGYTEDLRRAVAHVRASRPQARALTAAGYSLGASYLAKYVCEEGDRCVLAGAALFACMTDLVAGIARLSDSAAARHGQTAQLAAAPAATLPRQDPTPRACSGRPDPLGPSRLVYSSRLKVDALCRGRLPSGGNNKASTKGCKKGPACGGPRGEASPRACQRVTAAAPCCLPTAA